MSGGDVRSWRAWRRTACVGVVVGSAVLATAVTGLGTSAAQTGEATPFNNGIGSAVASSIRVDPIAGGLSFGIGVGEALAGHQNTVGTAEARTANLGVIGVTLAAEGCDGGDPTLPKEQQPQGLRVDSSQEGSDTGLSAEDSVVPLVQRTVRATDDPFAEAITASPGLVLPGLLNVGPTIARTTSGVFGDYREATAVVEIAHVEIAGLINLTGLRWEAIHRTGSREEQTGTFTIASATGPLDIPLPTDDILALLEQLNAVLRPLSLEIRLPVFHLDRTATSTLSTIEPFGIALIPGPLRDGVLAPLQNALQPAREAFFNALIEADCSNATYITILDVVLNATGPGGQLAIELGGAQASTSAITGFSGLGEFTPRTPTTSAPSPSRSTTGGGTTARPPTTTPRPTATTATTAAPDTSGDELEDAVDTADVSGERGGPLLAVGAGGLLLLLATAEGDRRKMRRAQREIPVEG